MKQIMVYKQNTLTENWLCHIPKTSQAYYCKSEKEARAFCDKINKDFEAGVLYFDDKGRVQIKDQV